MFRALALLTALSCFPAFALQNPLLLKENVRWSLWAEGLEVEKKPAPKKPLPIQAKRVALPMELELVLPR